MIPRVDLQNFAGFAHIYADGRREQTPVILPWGAWPIPAALLGKRELEDPPRKTRAPLRDRSAKPEGLSFSEIHRLVGGMIETEREHPESQAGEVSTNPVTVLPNRAPRLAALLEQRGLEFEAYVGAGRFGRVLRARDPRSGRRLALKLARGRRAARLLGEIGILEQLSHPGVLRYVSGGQSQSFVYSLTEWFEGKPWTRDWARRSDATRVELVRQLLRAIHFVHERGFVHGDLSAENVLASQHDEPRLQVLDFGLATPISGADRSLLQGATPRYAAPEVLRGAPTDRRADLFAIGAMLLEAAGCLEGEQLASTLVERAGEGWIESVVGRLPSELGAILPRLVSASVEARFPTAWHALEAMSEGAPLETNTGAIAYAVPPRSLSATACEVMSDWARSSRDAALPVLLFLRGEPGMGESELLSAAEQGAWAAGKKVWRIEARSGDAPFDPLRRLGLPITTTADAGGLEERRERAEASRAAVVDALLHAGEREALVIFENLHLADGETVAVCAQLVRGLVHEDPRELWPRVRLLLSGAELPLRNEEWANLDRRAGGSDWRRTIELERLTQREVEDWLRESFGAEGASATHWAGELDRLTGGHRESVRRLLEGAIESGALRPAVPRWELSGETALAELTKRSRDLSPAFEMSSPDLQEALGLLASFGRPLLVDLLSEAAEWSAADLQRVTREGLERRLLTERLEARGVQIGLARPEEGLAIAEAQKPRDRKRRQRRLAAVFSRHGLVAEASELWFEAGETDRALECVEEAFEALVRAGAGHRAFDLGRRAYRPLLARAPHEAIRIAIRLADLSLWLGEPKTAQRWLVGARKRLDPCDVSSKAGIERRLAEVAIERGRYEEAAVACERAREQGQPSSVEGLRLARLEAFARSMLGDYQATVDVCDVALRLEVDGGGTERAALANTQALGHLRLGHFDAAAEVARRGLELSGEEESAWWTAALQNTLGLLSRQRGDLDQAGRYFTSALEGFRAVSALKKVAHCRNNLGITSAELGDLEAAERHHRAALAIFERLGDPYGMASFTGSLGIDRLRRGSALLARADLDDALRLLRDVSAPREESLMRIHLATACARAGDLHRAERSLQRADDSIREHGLDAERRHWLAPALEIAALQGDRERFESVWAEAEEGASADVWLSAVRGRLALGDLEEAERLLTSGLHRSSSGARIVEAWSRYLEARLRESSPMSERIEILDQVLARTQDVSVRAASCFVLGRMYRSAGRSARAEDWAQRGRRELELACEGATNEEVEGAIMAFRKLAGLMGPEFDVEFAGTATRTSAPPSLEDLEKVYEVTRRLNSEDNPRRLLTFIIDTAVRLTLAERGFLILMRRSGHRFVVARNAQEDDIAAPEGEVSHSILQDVLESGRSVVTTDAGGDERFQAAASVEALDLTSVVCVPFRVGERVLGALYLDNPYRKGLFSERELRLAEAFSDQAGIAYRNLRERQRIRRLNRELRDRVVRQDRELRQTRRELAEGRIGRYGSIIGESGAMRQVFRLIDRLAGTPLSVLIEGESGTGKELVARELHRRSQRAEGPFLSENCSAIPRELLESEFFGHVKGAFTGATENREGLFVLASGGTLFLDEIGDMDLDLQKKLLRVLQEGEVRPVGGKKARPIDVRIVAATHRDLRAMIADGEFREDLFYRINVASIRLPALRERREDIHILIDHFLDELGSRYGNEKTIASTLRSRLVAYSWPGNVRELENEIARLYALSDQEIEDVSLLSDQVRGQLGEPVDAVDGSDQMPSLADIEQRALAETLAATGWDKEETARILGISRTSVYAKIKKYDLQPPTAEG
ncbi:MAG: sigma 54-interacting transcriptional regulator [Planctomycetota bacterium]